MTAPNFPHKFREGFLKHNNNKEYLNRYLAEKFTSNHSGSKKLFIIYGSDIQITVSLLLFHYYCFMNLVLTHLFPMHLFFGFLSFQGVEKECIGNEWVFDCTTDQLDMLLNKSGNGTK